MKVKMNLFRISFRQNDLNTLRLSLNAAVGIMLQTY